MATFAVIDRFEGDVAVLEEDGRERLVPRRSLHPSAREGDVVDLETGAPDPAQTARRKAELEQLRRKRPPLGGDFEL